MRLFAFSYGFLGGNLVVSLGISDHGGQDGREHDTCMIHNDRI